MYNIKLLNFEKKYLLEELIKIFLRPDQYTIIDDSFEFPNLLVFNEENYEDRNDIKRQIYDKLSDLTGKTPEWGILTGIRPVKLCGEIYEKNQSEEQTIDFLKDYYYISTQNARLVFDMYKYQIRSIGNPPHNSAGIYIGIPFCPTRCVYCSFASNQVGNQEIARYLTALHKEIEFVGRRMQETGIVAESIYIGGGTPTTLNEQQLAELIKKIKECFDFSNVKEFSVESGRPDTITDEKLRILKSFNVNRISINPQSMKDHTLELIGRKHSVKDIEECFQMSDSHDFDCVNADIIAGLPEESLEDFENTLTKIIELKPENITVHSLAVKRASKLIAMDENFHYKQAQIVSQMLKLSREILESEGYKPYYLYRQKHMAGAFENTGYCKIGKECVYNIRIMDEHQHIIALGAGGITKVYYPEENRLERVPNVTNYEEYINRIDEMIERKENNLFRR